MEITRMENVGSPVSLAGSTAILMLGMHRSGTSVSTRVVGLLGADLGNSFLPPAPDNPVGFWEHLGAHEIHERLLHALGREWHDISEMPVGWMDNPATHKAIDELVDLCRKEFAGSPLWAVKDPRMCRLAPVWLEALARLGVRATAVFVTRAPDEVASSLKKRDGWEEGHSHLMWVQHLLEAEQATRGIPRTMISYDRLMSNWRGAMVSTARDLGIDWPVPIADAGTAIDAFIDPSGFRHHNGRAAEWSSARSQFIDSLYRVSDSIQAGTAGWDALDGFETTYQRAVDLFGWAIAAHEHTLRVMRREMYILQADSHQVREENRTLLEEAENNLVHTSERFASLEALMHESGSKISELEAAGRVTEEALSRSEARCDALNAEKSALEAELQILKTNTTSRRWLAKKILRL